MGVSTVVLEAWGGPGTGKSVLAAAWYVEAARRGLRTELVREVAKIRAWLGQPITAEDEIELLTQQIKLETALYGKVDLIVTDSPIHMKLVYVGKYAPQMMTAARAVIRSHVPKVRRIRKLVTREGNYDEVGRFENQTEAEDVDRRCEAVLDSLGSWSRCSRHAHLPPEIVK